VHPRKKGFPEVFHGVDISRKKRKEKNEKPTATFAL
jgi:hypothetical protein